MLDVIIARLQSLISFNLYQVNADGSVSPWYEVSGANVIPDLVIREDTILEQVQTIAARIAHWGRLTAQAKRIWQIEDRNYRRWRDSFILEVLQASEKEGGKKPTDKTIEAMYRNNPTYSVLYDKVERAEEAYNAAQAILDGYRAKKDALKMSVYRVNEGDSSVLAI